MIKLIEQIEKILSLGTEQVTLTRSQVIRLLDHAKRTAAKSCDVNTKRLRLELYRSEAELKKVANRMEAARTWKAN